MEFELTPDFLTQTLSEAALTAALLQTNALSAEYGLVLSEQDAKMLAAAGKEALEIQDRIEFGKSVTVLLIEKFMRSTYLVQTEYAPTLAALLDVFYQAKEECLDILTDEEVLDLMFDFFERESGGSIELLQSRDLDVLCRKIRYTALGIAEDEEDLDV
ncbi:MAG: DUF6323 family protein [Oscillospiraceae bacterium]